LKNLLNRTKFHLNVVTFSRELDKIKNLHTASFNSSAIEINNDLEEEILSLFTVRVSMKTGVQRFEIKKVYTH